MNKKLKQADITLIGCGEAVTLTASDTATEPIAKYALDAFSVENQMHFKDNGTEYYVPFHAVDHIEVTETTESIADRPDPYGCEGSDGDSVWAYVDGEVLEFSMTPNETDIESGTTSKAFAEWKDAVVNYDGYTVKATYTVSGEVVEEELVFSSEDNEWFGSFGHITYDSETDEVSVSFYKSNATHIEVIVTKK